VLANGLCVLPVLFPSCHRRSSNLHRYCGTYLPQASSCCAQRHQLSVTRPSEHSTTQHRPMQRTQCLCHCCKWNFESLLGCCCCTQHPRLLHPRLLQQPPPPARPRDRPCLGHCCHCPFKLLLSCCCAQHHRQPVARASQHTTQTTQTMPLLPLPCQTPPLLLQRAAPWGAAVPPP
jgi:hypothetical protein